MKTNKEHRFPLSISTIAFADKIIANAMIGETNDENKAIRKKYGFPANKGAFFKQIEVTPEEALNYLLEGRSVCQCFIPDEIKADGSFSKTEKNNDNFSCAWFIGVDIDKTKYKTPEDFISKLTLKPTFYYTSYRNMQKDDEGNDLGARFRMFYVFEDSICKNPYVFKYIAHRLNTIIENDTDEIIKDKCNESASQYFNGTNRNKEGIVLLYDNFDTIYTVSDLKYTTEDIIEYMINNCEYKGRNVDREIEIADILHKLTGKEYVFNNSTMTFTEAYEGLSCTQTVNTPPMMMKCSQCLVNELKRYGFKDYDEFMKFNRHNYYIFYRTEKDEWLVSKNGLKYQITDDGYIELLYYKNKVQNGRKRRKKIFKRACVRRLIKNDVTADTLLVNAYDDACRFFEIDKDITIDCLVDNVERAMRLTLEDIELLFKTDNDRKKDMILKRGTCKTAPEAKKAYKEIRWENISDIYNKDLTLKENFDYIKRTLRIRVSKRTLYNYCKENGIKTNPKKNTVTDEELFEMIDPELTLKKNMEILKDSDINVGDKRVSKILKEKRNTEDRPFAKSIENEKIVHLQNP